MVTRISPALNEENVQNVNAQCSGGIRNHQDVDIVCPPIWKRLSHFKLNKYDLLLLHIDVFVWNNDYFEYIQNSL